MKGLVYVNVKEIKRALEKAHDLHGYFPPDFILGIIRTNRSQYVPQVDVVCCMLELLYNKKEED